MNILKPLYVALIKEALAVQPSLRVTRVEGARHDCIELMADGLVIIDGLPTGDTSFEEFLTMQELASFAVKAEAMLPSPHEVTDDATDWHLVGQPSAADYVARCNQLATQGLLDAATRFLVTGAPMQLCGAKAVLESLYVLSQIGLDVGAPNRRRHMEQVFQTRLGYSFD